MCLSTSRYSQYSPLLHVTHLLLATNIWPGVFAQNIWPGIFAKWFYVYVYDSFNLSPISLKPYQISSLTDFEHILQILDRGFILHPGSYMRDYWNVSPASFIAQWLQKKTQSFVKTDPMRSICSLLLVQKLQSKYFSQELRCKTSQISCLEKWHTWK